MLDAQAIDYCAPQYYDGPNLSDPAYLLQNIEIWINLLGPENVVVGFGVNDERNNYWKINAVVEAFKKVKAQYPNIKGVFDWRRLGRSARLPICQTARAARYEIGDQ